MKVRLMFTLVNKKFCELSLKTKIQLYILPLLFLSLLFIVFPNEKKSNNFTHTKKEKQKIDYFIVYKDIESYLKKQKVHLKALNFEKESFFINFESSLDKAIEIFFFVENLNIQSNLKELKIKKLNKKKNEIIIKLNFFNKSKKLITNNHTKKQKKFLLKAFIGEKVFINNKWYSLDEKISNYKIKKISNNSVVLIKEKEEILLKVFKND